MVSKDFDFDLPNGRVHARRWGSPDRPAVLGVSGLTANLMAFEALAGVLEPAGFQLIAHDMRGRGHSENTPAGSYGWPSHAADIIAMTEKLGIERFDYIGWSTGSLIGLHIHRLVPERLRRLVLLDQVAAAPQGILAVAEQVISRLEDTVPTLQGYIDGVRNVGIVRPWSPMWDTYFAYEMEPVPDGAGYRPRTSKSAIREDFDWDLVHDGRDLWDDVSCPVLLVRGMEGMTPDSGLVIPDDMLADFLRAVPDTELLEVPFSHFGVGTSEKAGAAVVDFLSRT